MSGLLRWRRLAAVATRAASTLTAPECCSPAVVAPPHRRVQERRKWEGPTSSSSSSSDEHEPRRIRAEAHCPRCSKHMDILFSHRAPPSSSAAAGAGAGGGGYQALNLCPNCRSAYFFRPHLLAPLQGTFVEIGRVRADLLPHDAVRARGASFWEAIRGSSSSRDDGDGGGGGGPEEGRRSVEAMVEAGRKAHRRHASELEARRRELAEIAREVEEERETALIATAVLNEARDDLRLQYGSRAAELEKKLDAARGVLDAAAARERRAAENEAASRQREEALEARATALEERARAKERDLADREAAVAIREATLAAHEAACAEEESALRLREDALTERERALEEAANPAAPGHVRLPLPLFKHRRPPLSLFPHFADLSRAPHRLRAVQPPAAAAFATPAAASRR